MAESETFRLVVRWLVGGEYIELKKCIPFLKRKKRRLFFLGVCRLLLVLLGVGAVLSHTLWLYECVCFVVIFWGMIDGLIAEHVMPVGCLVNHDLQTFWGAVNYFFRSWISNLDTFFTCMHLVGFGCMN